MIVNELEKNQAISKNLNKAPLENGVLVCVNSKLREYEFVNIWDVPIPDAEKRGIKEGTTLGAYVDQLESALESVNNRFDKLCDIVELMNSKPKRAQ